MRAWLPCLLLLLGMATRDAHAQVDPRGPYRTLHTPHFRVHFKPGHDSLARRAAVLAEQAYVLLARELPTPDGPVELLLADNVDRSNGYAQVFPTNRVVIYLLPPAFVQELRFSGDWLRLVITHEVAHIFHIDRARGLWAAGRLVLGRNPMLFPNAFVPSWVKEGLAVHYETSLTGVGRNASTDFRTIAQAAALERRIPSPNQWSLATSRFPLGHTAYAWGSLLMERAAHANPDSGMRRFVDVVARDFPFRLTNASRQGFGQSFGTLFADMRDSMYRAAAQVDTSGDAVWDIVSHRGFHAAAPRWRGTDTLLWTANDGREVSGLYRAVLSHGDNVHRIAWRNSLDANVPANGNVVFAQHDLRDPYTFRTDLYEGHGRSEQKLTDGARIAQPDVRADGEIVAAQITAGVTRLVRVSRDGTRIAVLTAPSTDSWSDPRWSPSGNAVAAVELLQRGEQRVVVLDTMGNVLEIVAGGRAVFGSPSFTPDGRRLVWTSDRSGRTQLETAQLRFPDGPVDTTDWRAEREGVRMASNVSTGVFQPSVSPDGQRVAALLYKLDGYMVAVAPLDTSGQVARNRWYARSDSLGQRVASGWTRSDEQLAFDTLSARRYNPLGQLLPHYWMPAFGAGRFGTTYGVSSSGSDILSRHQWFATALVGNGDVEGSFAYRYAGLGVPLLDLSVLQQWDEPFRIVDQSGAFLGDLYRRRRFATVSTAWLVPRMRRSLLAQFGTQLEMRHFESDSDAVLGPPESITRRGTKYYSLFGTLSAATTRAGARAISAEEGFSLSVSSAYRWRTDVRDLTASWRTIGVGRGFIPLDLPGFARHAIAARVAAGSADSRTASEFSIGGEGGISTEVIPGTSIGEARTFAIRGVAPGIQRGTRAVTAMLEYRAPLALLSVAPGPIPLFADRLSLNVFGDAGRAWCPAGVATLFEVCERRKALDGWIVTTGAELSLDMAVQYDIPFRMRGGFGVPVVAPAGVPRGVGGFVAFGSSF